MDTELVVRAQQGDEGAFASLAGAAGDRLHAVAHRILRDIDLAEDATQQALLSIWRDLPQLRDPARFEAWSYRLLVRACYADAGTNTDMAPSETLALNILDVGGVRLVLVVLDDPEQPDSAGASQLVQILESTRVEP